MSKDNVDAKYKFNKSQHKLIDSISRYVALFALASLTSLITIMFILFDSIDVEFNDEWILTTAAVDCMVNFLCLYLQYSFASKYYSAACKYLHFCSKTLFVIYIGLSIKKDYLIKIRSESTITQKK
eukprot:96606_1